MKFRTETGSIYEVDYANNAVRRLSNSSGREATPRQGKDGEWRKYVNILPATIRVGKSVIIVWDAETPLLPDSPSDVIRTTVTSPVVEIS